MNTIISCAIGIIGGGSFAIFTVGLLWSILDPYLFPDEQPRDQSTICHALLYIALSGATCGLFLILASGQRL